MNTSNQTCIDPQNILTFPDNIHVYIYDLLKFDWD